jgi:hypothetical protein
MLDVCVFSVEEVIHCKRIGFIYMLRAVNRLKHRSNNDVRVNDCEIEDRIFGSEEVPCGLFTKLLRSVISQDRGLRFNCILFCDLVV